MSSFIVLTKLAQIEQQLDLLSCKLSAQGEILQRLTDLLEAQSITPEEVVQIINRLKGSATKLQSIGENRGNPTSTH